VRFLTTFTSTPNTLTTANKPILQIEYSNASFAAVCRKQRDFGVRSIWKDPALTSAPRRVCWFEPLASDGLRYQYQLGKAFDPNPKKKQFIAGVSVYFLDGDGTSASTVAAIRAKGFYPVCYFSAGSWENCECARGLWVLECWFCAFLY